MLTDIKAWMETTGYRVAEECFLKPPALPYIIFRENISITGADDKNGIENREISIELYTDKINKTAEKSVEDLLNEKSIQYKKNRIWVDSETFFETIYDFNLVEKI